MAKDKKTDKKELKKQLAVEKVEQSKKKEALERLKPLFFSFILWGILMGLIYIPVIHQATMSFFVDFVVESTVFLGNLLFFPVESSGSPLIQVAGYHMKVIFECTAYNFYLFALALVVFGKWSLKDKIINFIIFIISIFILNAFRFIIMGYVGKFFPSAFHQVHDYVCTIVFGLVVFILYIWRNDQSLITDD
ncbi:MAG: hypothetical protein GQ527_11295 [Bacteroidales bacterium]|nr:hypothetical protein [Bacteroidales bacterium]